MLFQPYHKYMASTVVRVKVMGADVDLYGDKGKVSVGYLKPSVWGTYRWCLNSPGGEGRHYWTQKADRMWRVALGEYLSHLWGHDIIVVGDNLTPGPQPRAAGLVGP